MSVILRRILRSVLNNQNWASALFNLGHRVSKQASASSKVDKVALGKLEGTNVPVAVQKIDEKSYGSGVDGLPGMTFLV